MKKKFIFVVSLIFIALLAAGVFAQSANNSVELNESENAEEINEIIEEVLVEEEPEIEVPIEEKIDDELQEKVKPYVKEFVEKRGIDPEKIKNISEVDFNALPKEVNIENVNDANLAIYQVDYEEETESEEQKVFVVTYSVEQLKGQGDLIIAKDKRQFLNFGFADISEESRFLKTATGAEGSIKTGYVMMRAGSITGISTSLEIVNANLGDIEIIIYKNGEEIQFGNTIETSDIGAQKDYDVQSKDVVTFEPGDVISAYLQINSQEIAWKDAITLVEITTIN